MTDPVFASRTVMLCSSYDASLEPSWEYPMLPQRHLPNSIGMTLHVAVFHTSTALSIPCLPDLAGKHNAGYESPEAQQELGN